MSLGYADRLKTYPNKGVCGLPEQYDTERALQNNLRLLVEHVRKAKHLVIFTGAGISTSAGIPDFRGPNGIWTVQKNKERVAKRQREEEKARRPKAAKSESRRTSYSQETLDALRAVTGSDVTEELLLRLLSRARGNVQNAANLYYEESWGADSKPADGADSAEAAEDRGASSEAGGSNEAGGGSESAGSTVIDFATAAPTLTHMAFVELQRRGKLQYLITQNGETRRRARTRPARARLRGGCCCCCNS